MSRSMSVVISGLVALVVFAQCIKGGIGHGGQSNALVNEGKQIFRFDTFGDEEFWSGLLHIDKAIAGAENGGFGQGVSPTTALSVGLKVDAEALPAEG